MEWVLERLEDYFHQHKIGGIVTCADVPDQNYDIAFNHPKNPASWVECTINKDNTLVMIVKGSDVPLPDAFTEGISEMLGAHYTERSCIYEWHL